MITFSLRISDAPNERLFPLSWCSFSSLMKIAYALHEQKILWISVRYVHTLVFYLEFTTDRSTFQLFVFHPLHLVFVKSKKKISENCVYDNTKETCKKKLFRHTFCIGRDDARLSSYWWNICTDTLWNFFFCLFWFTLTMATHKIAAKISNTFDWIWSILS